MIPSRLRRPMRPTFIGKLIALCGAGAFVAGALVELLRREGKKSPPGSDKPTKPEQIERTAAKNETEK